MALYHFFSFRWSPGSDIYFSWCSGSFSPVKISVFKHSFEYLSPCTLLKLLNNFFFITVTTGKPRFHGNQQMIHLLIPSLLASFKTGLSEFRAVKFRYFCVKKRGTPKYLLVKSKQILYIFRNAERRAETAWLDTFSRCRYSLKTKDALICVRKNNSTEWWYVFLLLLIFLRMLISWNLKDQLFKT